MRAECWWWLRRENRGRRRVGRNLRVASVNDLDIEEFLTEKNHEAAESLATVEATVGGAYSLEGETIWGQRKSTSGEDGHHMRKKDEVFEVEEWQIAAGFASVIGANERFENAVNITNAPKTNQTLKLFL